MLGGEPHEGLTPEDRQAQREQRVGIGEVSARELCDAPKAMTNGVPMEVQLARDAVDAALKSKVRVERLHEIRVPLVSAERTEDAIGERADLARGLAEDEAIGTEVVEVRRAAVAVRRAAEREGLLGLDKREVGAGRSGLRTCDARRELVVRDVGGHARAQPLPFAARVDGRGRRYDGSDETARGADDARVVRDGRGNGGAQLRGRTGVAACERDREVPCVARRSLPLTKKPPHLGGFRVVRWSCSLASSASQRLVRLLKDEKVDRDDDDERPEHESVRLVRHAHLVNVYGGAARISEGRFSTIREPTPA